MTNSSSDYLREEYTIDTPENVSFGYEVTGIGSRFIGALIDSSILVIALILLNFAIFVAVRLVEGAGGASVDSLEETTGWTAGLLLALYALVNFALIWGYYILFELLWAGQTPGKRVAKTRVVAMDGSAAGVLEVVIRNLVRVIDFLPFAYAIGLVTMFFNRHARRLGDFAAGTLVVKAQGETGLESLGRSANRSTPGSAQSWDERAASARNRFPNLDRLNADDYELITEVLSRHNQGIVSTDMLYRAARAIAHKLATPEPPLDWSQNRQFLRDVADAYRFTNR